ncbi:hypothetical protein ACR3K2_34350 [Cryptosporidium serpentis]
MAYISFINLKAGKLKNLISSIKTFSSEECTEEKLSDFTEKMVELQVKLVKLEAKVLYGSNGFKRKSKEKKIKEIQKEIDELKLIIITCITNISKQVEKLTFDSSYELMECTLQELLDMKRILLGLYNDMQLDSGFMHQLKSVNCKLCEEDKELGASSGECEGCNLYKREIQKRERNMDKLQQEVRKLFSKIKKCTNYLSQLEGSKLSATSSKGNELDNLLARPLPPIPQSSVTRKPIPIPKPPVTKKPIPIPKPPVTKKPIPIPKPPVTKKPIPIPKPPVTKKPIPTPRKQDPSKHDHTKYKFESQSNTSPRERPEPEYAELVFNDHDHKHKHKPNRKDYETLYSMPMIIGGSVVTVIQPKGCSDEDLRSIKQKISDLEEIFMYALQLPSNCDNSDCNSEHCKGCLYAKDYKFTLMGELEESRKRLNAELKDCIQKNKDLNK